MEHSEVYPVKFAPYLSGEVPYSDYPTADDPDQAQEEFTGKTAFQLLQLQYKQQSLLHATFLASLKKVTAGLHDLLFLQEEGSKPSTDALDFAEELISFDKIRDTAVSSVSARMPPARLNRLRAALQTLSAAQVSYAQHRLTIFSSEEIVQSFDLERTFDEADIKVASGDTCAQARVHSRQDIAEWIQVMAALRMGELLIAQKYEERLHDAYFDHFDLHYLTREDLKYLPQTLVVEDSRQLMQQANDFLALLTNDGLVKVLGITLLDQLFEQEDQHYLELASLAIFRRNSYVFQGGIDRPFKLQESFKKGVTFPGSVFWNMLIPGGEREAEPASYFTLLAAIESRYFPRIEYETDDNHFDSQHVNLQDNPGPNTSFATYEPQFKAIAEGAAQVYHFTVADFLAMQSEGRKTLKLIPATDQNSHLLPLGEYLSQSRDALVGKIPFIWLVDDQNELQQAAVPTHWLKTCRDRLEYWQFLQSIAGIDQAQLQATREQLQAEWDQAKNAEIENLKASLHTQFDQERSADLQAAVVRMLNGLLKQGNGLESALTAISQDALTSAIPPQQAAEPPTATSVAAQEEEKQAPTVVPTEAWVESDECTSCRDCIDALPAVFKYNDDKQAYVHNPQGGTFPELVAAAEKCPARCIYPGAPPANADASLAKWIKRAEKFQ